MQRFLLTHRDTAKQVPFIYFLSTPHTGAEIASLAHVFSADPLLKQLVPGDQNDYLLNLEAEWRAAAFQNIRRYCAYETQPYRGVLVVDRLSSTRDCDNAVPINANHVSIVKPCSPADDSYITLLNAWKANPLPPPVAKAHSRIAAPADHPTAPKLPLAAPDTANCGPVPAPHTAPSAVPGTDFVGVEVTRGSSASGATTRDFVTSGKGTYHVEMDIAVNWRPEVLEFRFASNKSITVERDKPLPVSLRDSGYPLTVERLTNTGFEIDDSKCAGIPYTVVWMRGSEINDGSAAGRAVLRPAFYDINDLAFSLVNLSDVVAQEPKYAIGIADLSNQYYASYERDQPPRPQPLPIPTHKVDDYVRPHERLDKFKVMNDNSWSHVKKGDVLFGQVILTCMNCDKQRYYWLYWKIGEVGWYEEIPDDASKAIPFIQLPSMTNTEIASDIEALVPRQGRIAFLVSQDELNNH